MFNKDLEIETNEELIDDLLERGVSEIYPTKERLKEQLLSGKKLRIYAGADATGPSIHLGHTKIFIMLEKLRKMGHEVIILFGDFTAKIGDPTDKSAARVRLTDKEVKHNLSNWKKQISKVVKIGGFGNSAKIVLNSEWLSKMTFDDVVDLASNFTVQQMLERDMFEKRINEGKPVYVHEFFYPLMQGYDSVHLDVDLEIGGTDQTFNMLAGRTLLSKIKNKEKSVLTVGLIEDPETGKKLMSKSEGDAVWLDDSANEMFGKIMSLPDTAIVPMLLGTTLMKTEEVNNIEKELKEGMNPRDAKIILGKEVVKIYHGEQAAKTAEENFINTFSKDSMPDDVKKKTAAAHKPLGEFLVQEGLVDSKSEWRRLVENGAIKDLKTGDKIKDPNQLIEKGLDLKIGKKKFIKILVTG
jgi:tyrosyl-tRNA synthetase